MNEQSRMDFSSAMGHSFSNHVSPPVPVEDVNAHGYCEAIWSVLGVDVTPEDLASLDEQGVHNLAQAFATYFESEPPTTSKIKKLLLLHFFAGRWEVSEESREKMAFFQQ